MSEMKHTPGPWSFSPFSMTGAVWAGNEFIASVYPNAPKGWDGLSAYHRSDEMKANAQLIAAAPAMYEALQFADGYLDGHMTIEAAGLPSPTAHWETLLDKIRAAIASAEGRAP